MLTSWSDSDHICLFTFFTTGNSGDRSVLFNETKNHSMSGQPAGRIHALGTLESYTSADCNCETDWQAIFFDEYPYPSWNVCDQHRAILVAAWEGAKIFHWLYVGNALADRAQIWYAPRHPPANDFAKVGSSINLHAPGAPLKYGNSLCWISALAWSIVLIFGMRREAHQLMELHGSGRGGAGGKVVYGRPEACR